MKKKQLLQEIESLEIATNHRTAVVLALLHAVKPTNTFRYHYTPYSMQTSC